MTSKGSILKAAATLIAAIDPRLLEFGQVSDRKEREVEHVLRDRFDVAKSKCSPEFLHCCDHPCCRASASGLIAKNTAPGGRFRSRSGDESDEGRSSWPLKRSPIMSIPAPLPAACIFRSAIDIRY
ncbi:MAG: hypothetical protein WDN69_00920 [Aliidongia sp.]